MLGGFAPMPLRLGGGDVDGWTAAQHARAAADLSACVRTSPFAWVTYDTRPGSVGVATVLSYNGMDGVGSAHYPTITQITFGEVELEWSASYEDPYERPEPVNLRHAKATVRDSAGVRAIIVSVARNKVTIAAFSMFDGSPSDCLVSVRVT